MSQNLELAISSLIKHRDDVFFKLPLARNLIGREKRKQDQKLYLDHIYTFNGFFEEDPRKSNSRDFLNSFKELGEFYTDSQAKSVIPALLTDVEGNLKNGSHRLALQMALKQINPNVPQELNLDKSFVGQLENWDFNYFSAKGMKQQDLDRGILERVSFFREAHSATMLVFPKAEKFAGEIFAQIDKQNVKINSVTKVIVDSDLLSKIVAIAYSEHDFSSTVEGINNKCEEAGAYGLLYVISLQESDLTNLQDLKTEIRKIWNNNFQGIHITDDWWESFSLYSTLTHQGSLDFIHSISLDIFVKSLSKFSKESRELNSKFSTPFDFAISGSSILEVMGLRAAKDLDIIVSQRHESEFSESSLLSRTIDLDNKYFREFNLEPAEILDRSDKYIWLFGMKFIKVEVLEKIWRIRNEAKDLIFLKEISHNTPSRKRLLFPSSQVFNYGLEKTFLERVVSEKYLITEIRAQRDELTQQRDELTQQRDELTQQRDELTQQRDELLSSTIWRMTEPIRWFIALLKN